MRYFNVEQGSSEWFKIRLGVPTASNFSRILTPKTGALSKQADEYIAELIGESLSTIPPEGVENYMSRSMSWGLQAEEQARRLYCAGHDCTVENGGFCMTNDGRFGSSPDFLVAVQSTGELEVDPIRGQYALATVARAGELKCPQPKTQTLYLLADALPAEYKWQVHGHLIVTGAEYCDFLSYCPGLPAFMTRIEPNEDTLTLRKALEEFWERYQVTLKRVEEMRS